LTYHSSATIENTRFFEGFLCSSGAFIASGETMLGYVASGEMVSGSAESGETLIGFTTSEKTVIGSKASRFVAWFKARICIKVLY